MDNRSRLVISLSFHFVVLLQVPQKAELVAKIGYFNGNKTENTSVTLCFSGMFNANFWYDQCNNAIWYDQCKMQNAKCKMQNAKCKWYDQCKMQNAKCKMQNANGMINANNGMINANKWYDQCKIG